jgi:hypothetical protein
MCLLLGNHSIKEVLIYIHPILVWIWPYCFIFMDNTNRGNYRSLKRSRVNKKSKKCQARADPDQSIILNNRMNKTAVHGITPSDLDNFMGKNYEEMVLSR